MKRILALTLAALTLILTACGSVNTPTETTAKQTTDTATTEVTPTETTEETTIAQTTPAVTYPPATVPTFTTAVTEQTTTIVTPVIPEGYSKNLIYISNGDGTCYLDRRGDCTDSYIKIPSVSPMGDRVTAISEHAFRGDAELYSVTIPESVTKIGKGAFASCQLLTEVSIKNGITEIPEDAFRDCPSLSKVTLPDTLKRIGKSAFQRCPSLVSIGFPNALAYIGESAFEDCGLKYLVFPRSLTKIDNRSFYSCDGLIRVNFAEGLYSIGEKAFYDCLAIESIALPSSLRDVGAEIFNFRNLSIFTYYEHAYYVANSTNPYFLLLKSDSLDIESFVIHPDTEVIAGNAYRGCSLPHDLILPHTIRGIGPNAFALCSNLENLVLGNNLEHIGYQAFLHCPIKDLTIPVNVRVIDDRAFEHGAMKTITLNGGEALGDMAFAFSTAQSIIISTQTKNLPYRLFYNAPYMNDIRYLGTVEQWNAIAKAEGWDEGMGGKTPEGTKRDPYTIHCTDNKIVVPIS